MSVPVYRRAPPLPLATRRIALQGRIRVAREETADVLQHLANDVRATDQTRRRVQNGWQLVKAATVAAGVVWSFNATSNSGRGRRFFTLAVSVLSSMRALRKISAFLLPLTQSHQHQG
jgi:hypothetical protein